MKTFQVPRKLKAASVTRIGRSSGSTTLRKIWNSPAPSTRAASSSSSGMPRAYWRIMKMPKMLASAAIMTPHGVLTRPRPRTIRNNGSMPTWAGTTSPTTSSWKTRSRPAKRSFANAYPARALMNSETIVVTPEISRLLRKFRSRLSRVNSAT